MSLKLDRTKEYTLKSGAKYKFYSDNNGGERPIHGAMLVKDKHELDVWVMITHTNEGKASNAEWDIVTPKKQVLWLRPLETILSEVEKNWSFDYKTDGSIEGIDFLGLYVNVRWFEYFDKPVHDAMPFCIRDEWVEKREVDDI